MSNTNDQLITELRTVLSSQQYSPMVVGNYCAYAAGSLTTFYGGISRSRM
jgi:integrase/recombinase XerD